MTRNRWSLQLGELCAPSSAKVDFMGLVTSLKDRATPLIGLASRAIPPFTLPTASLFRRADVWMTMANLGAFRQDRHLRHGMARVMA